MRDEDFIQRHLILIDDSGAQFRGDRGRFDSGRIADDGPLFACSSRAQRAGNHWRSRLLELEAKRDAAMLRFNLRGLESYLAVLSGNDQSVNRCTELRQQYGDDPSRWLPHFYKEISA